MLRYTKILLCDCAFAGQNNVYNHLILLFLSFGTELTFIPGMLHGGTLSMSCDLGRALSYYIEPLLMLAPFCKQPIRATLIGVTNNQRDISVRDFNAG